MTPDPVTDGIVTLRVWEPEEAEVYCAIRDELIFRFTTEDPALDPDTARARIDAAARDPHLVPFAVRTRGGEPVGNLAVARRRSGVEMSYWLAPTARGRGTGSRALLLATDWAFGTWGADRVRLEIDPANEASIRMAEGCHYVPAGTRLVSACGGPALLFDAFPEHDA